MDRRRKQTLPYEGVRVVDFTQFQQGAMATQILADYGADVIKVEPPGLGERGRSLPPFINGMSCYWLAVNRNKRSLTLDLKRAEARDIIMRLCGGSDVVASNFRPDTMVRLGLGPEAVRAANPQLIYAVATGYGLTGPYSDRPGQDLVAQATGGLMAMTGEADGPPTPTGTFIADFTGALLFAQAIMAALAQREKIGEGQVVETSLLDGVIASHIQENAAVLNLGTTYPRPPRGGGHSSNPPTYAVYRCRDDRYIALMGGGLLAGFVDNVLDRISTALEIDPPIRADPKWMDGDRLTPRCWNDLRPRLEAAFAAVNRDEAVDRLWRQGVLSGPVHDLDEVFSDPQVTHNETVIDVDHPRYGRVRLTGSPTRLSSAPGRLRLPPPVLGEHNRDILRSLGYPDQEISRLQDAGVVGREAEE